MSQHHFIALDVATQAARAVLELLDSVPALPKGLAGQCSESAVSAPSNLAEASGRAGRDRLYHFRVALGSAKEAKSQLGLVVGLGLVDEDQGRAALALLDRTCALVWRLVHGRR